MPTTAPDDLPRGAQAPDFSLPEPGAGRTVRRVDFEASPLVVAFLCNHCPYVVHVADALGEFAREAAGRGVRTVAICSNDAAAYPDDAPERMPAFAEAHGFDFPYLHDADQEVARAFRAACTPDLYLFDADHRLFYRGQFDATRPGGEEPTGADLRAALDELLAGASEPSRQTPSVGCSIKWKAG